MSPADANGLVALATLITLAPFMFFVFTVVVMIFVVVRLRHVREELKVLNHHMMAIRFPHLPWPQPRPSQVLATEWRQGVAWRMRGDGRWEHHRGLSWQPANPEAA